MIAGMTSKPVNLTAALASFDEVYSPRIVARMNDYDVRVAHARGAHVWHVHEDTDEFFLVLDGRFDVATRDADSTETVVELHPGDTYVVPKGTAHKPSSPGSSILMFEPTGTSSTGDRHEGDIPDHVDSTTGRELSTRGGTIVTVSSFTVVPIGWVASPLVDRTAAPRQGDEGAPESVLVFEDAVTAGLADVLPAEEFLVLTWLHQARRDVLKTHPRSDPSRPEHGVFSTRSPDRPNPIGLHRVRVLAVDGNRVRVANLEAIDGTPILDVKPVLGDVGDR
jgi:tRNA-Thr(GGU) m(6)t(6)A37 methyltransferase TsaA